MIINFEQSVREFNFLRVHRLLVGNVPHVSNLAFIPANAFLIETAKQVSRMQRDLQMQNYGPLRMKGKRESWAHAFLVPHISRDKAAETGAKFNQECIIWGNRSAESFLFEQIRCATRRTTHRRLINVTQTGEAALISGHRVSVRFLENATSPLNKQFYIPFVDEVVVGVVPDVLDAEDAVAFNEADLPKTDEVRKLVEEIRTCEEGMGAAGVKWAWESRGHLLISLHKLERLVRGQ